jgi:hypothetical protein
MKRGRDSRVKKAIQPCGELGCLTTSARGETFVRDLRRPSEPRQELIQGPHFYLYWFIAGPRYHPAGEISRPQRHQRREFAHRRVEASLRGNDPDAPYERAHSLLPLLEAQRGGVDDPRDLIGPYKTRTRISLPLAF